MIKRDVGIELLRCVLMYCIVLWHCSMWCPNCDVRISKFLASIPVFAVDAFILISGWYGVTFSWRKVSRLLLLGLYSAIVVCGLVFLLDGRFCFRYSLGWFGLAYLALLFLSPLINSGLDALESKGALIRFWFAYSLLMFVSWIPIVDFGIDLSIPGFGGMSVNTMVYVYVTGRILRVYDRHLASSRAVFFAIFFGLALLNIALAIGSWLTKCAGNINLLFSCWRVNDSPLVVAMAIAFFMIFIRSSPCLLVGKVATFLAPSMFSVYLLHCGTNSGVTKELLFKLPCFLSDSPVAQIGKVVVIAGCIFVCSIGIDLLRRVCWHAFGCARRVA